MAVVAAVVLGAAVLFVGAFSLTSGTAPERWDYYWTDYFQKEKERMAAQHAGPRILLFGSSSTFFGIKAAEIEKATGIPTINMGTHGGNGLAYTLSEARKTSRAGDIAIILTDLSTWLLPQPIQRQGVAVSYGLDNDFFRSASLPDKLTILSHVYLSDINYAIRNPNRPLKKMQAGGYWPFPINENGDLALPQPDQKAIAIRDTQFANYGMSYLENMASSRRRAVKDWSILGLFERYVLGRVDDGEIGYDAIGAARATNAVLAASGVHYYYAVPPSIFVPNQRMAADLIVASDGKQLGDPSDSVLPLDMMYDTLFHAGPDGAERVTAKMIAALCKVAVVAAHGGCAEQRAPGAGGGQPQ